MHTKQCKWSCSSITQSFSARVTRTHSSQAKIAFCFLLVFSSDQKTNDTEEVRSWLLHLALSYSAIFRNFTGIGRIQNSHWLELIFYFSCDQMVRLGGASILDSGPAFPVPPPWHLYFRHLCKTGTISPYSLLSVGKIQLQHWYTLTSYTLCI